MRRLPHGASQRELAGMYLLFCMYDLLKPCFVCALMQSYCKRQQLPRQNLGIHDCFCLVSHINLCFEQAMKRKLLGGALGASFLKVFGGSAPVLPYRSNLDDVPDPPPVKVETPSLSSSSFQTVFNSGSPLPPVSSTLSTNTFKNEPAPSKSFASVFKSDIHSLPPASTHSSSVHVPFFTPGYTDSVTPTHDTNDIDLDYRTSTLPLYITLQIPIPRHTTSSSVTAKANLKNLKKKSYQVGRQGPKVLRSTWVVLGPSCSRKSGNPAVLI